MVVVIIMVGSCAGGVVVIVLRRCCDSRVCWPWQSHVGDGFRQQPDTSFRQKACRPLCSKPKDRDRGDKRELDKTVNVSQCRP